MAATCQQIVAFSKYCSPYIPHKVKLITSGYMHQLPNGKKYSLWNICDIINVIAYYDDMFIIIQNKSCLSLTELEIGKILIDTEFIVSNQKKWSDKMMQNLGN